MRRPASTDRGAPPRDEARDAAAERRAVGLCVDCRHTRRIVSAKGSAFRRCERARTDASLRDYPPLPVRACHGFERGAPPGGDD